MQLIIESVGNAENLQLAAVADFTDNYRLIVERMTQRHISRPGRTAFEHRLKWPCCFAGRWFQPRSGIPGILPAIRYWNSFPIIASRFASQPNKAVPVADH